MNRYLITYAPFFYIVHKINSITANYYNEQDEQLKVFKEKIDRLKLFSDLQTEMENILIECYMESDKSPFCTIPRHKQYNHNFKTFVYYCQNKEKFVCDFICKKFMTNIENPSVYECTNAPLSALIEEIANRLIYLIECVMHKKNDIYYTDLVKDKVEIIKNTSEVLYELAEACKSLENDLQIIKSD